MYHSNLKYCGGLAQTLKTLVTNKDITMIIVCHTCHPGKTFNMSYKGITMITVCYTGHPWQMWVTTGEQEKELIGGVVLVFYGDQGKSEEVVLGQGEQDKFKAGQTSVVKPVYFQSDDQI